MKDTFFKHSNYSGNRFIFLLSIGMILFSFFFSSNAFAGPTKIDEVYIERTTKISSIKTSNLAGKRMEESYRLNETKIENGDVIAFDIPGLNAYLNDNNKLLKNVTLLIGKIELEEFPAYIENSGSDVVRFLFSKKDLTSENRVQLYKLPGHEVKEVLVGIEIDESKSFFFSDTANIHLKEFTHRGIFGWSIIAVFVAFFLILIFKFDTVIKDSFNTTIGSKKPDTTFSFSKSQFAFWTFIIIASFIYIWALSGDLASINTTALILLGITSATITTSNLINKSEEENASKDDEKMKRLKFFRVKDPKDKSNFIQDILSDANGISIHRLQAFVFNLVFGIAFFLSVLTNFSMPEFSDTQLILLGLSNGTYAFLKNSENK